MRELKDLPGWGELAYIYKVIPGLNSGGLRGFVERWYSGCNDGWDGIPIDKKGLIYAEVVARGQGLPLGGRSFYGIVNHDKFYDSESFLVNGTILTTSHVREFFGKDKVESPRIRVSAQIPEGIVNILAETRERVLETARMLHLPLERAVAVTG